MDNVSPQPRLRELETENLKSHFCRQTPPHSFNSWKNWSNIMADFFSRLFYKTVMNMARHRHRTLTKNKFKIRSVYLSADAWNNVSYKTLKRSWNKLLKRNKWLNPAKNDNSEEDCTNEIVDEIIHRLPGCEDVPNDILRFVLIMKNETNLALVTKKLLLQ